jgi:hypothetical protein
LHGLDIFATSENYYFDSTEVEAIYQKIEEINRMNTLYWTVLTDENTVADRETDYP